MRGLLDGLYRASGYLGALFLLAILVVVLAQVGANLLDVLAHALTGEYQGFVVPSYADFAGFLMVGGTFLALAHTFHAGAHIRVSLLLQFLPFRIRQAADVFSGAVALVLSGYFSWFCWALVAESWAYGDTSSGLVAVPLYLPQSAMALGATVLTIAIADTLFTSLRGGETAATRLVGAADVVKESSHG